MCKEILLIVIVAVLGFTCLVFLFKKMKDGFGPFNLKVYGLTIIIVLAALLVLSDLTSEKLLPCFSLLSAIAGYLFGLKKEEK
jgi:hypothetical protein